MPCFWNDMQVFVFGLRGQQQGHAHFDDQEEEGGVTGEPWTPICNKALGYVGCGRSWLVSLAPTSMLRSALIPACSPYQRPSRNRSG